MIFSRLTLATLTVTLTLISGVSAMADVKLPAIIGDNMVIQQGMAFKIWGWADAGEKVTVTIGAQKVQTTADDKGNWMVKLDALNSSAEPVEMTVAGKNTLTVKNILVGEVWLCSGQSNMEMSVGQSKNAKEETASADHPTIRLFNICPTKHISREPQTDLKTSWQVCSPETVKTFSAVGYFFGRHISGTAKVPVGLINASWGGSPVEQWIPPSSYLSDPELGHFVSHINKELESFPKRSEVYPQQLANWKAATQQVVATMPAAATQPNLLPRQPAAPRHPADTLGGMYNGNIAPLTNLAIKGVIWYQGERNARCGDPIEYRKTFPALIRGWRNVWGQGDFPFLYVQLTNFMARQDDPNITTNWTLLREAQTMTLATPQTGMAVIIDVGETSDIHPKDKQTVGYRLGLIAQAIAYGQQDVQFAGPMFESMKVEGAKIIVKFKNADGLMAKGDKVKGFAIAGADGKYAWADAKIEGNSVVLTSEKVPAPAMVRYAFQDNPAVNLYNASGLPACPFRAGEPQAAK